MTKKKSTGASKKKAKKAQKRPFAFYHIKKIENEEEYADVSTIWASLIDIPDCSDYIEAFLDLCQGMMDEWEDANPELFLEKVSAEATQEEDSVEATAKTEVSEEPKNHRLVNIAYRSIKKLGEDRTALLLQRLEAKREAKKAKKQKKKVALPCDDPTKQVPT